MSETASDSLMRFGMFAGLMLLVGRTWWPVVFVAYVTYRFLITDFGRRMRQTLARDFQGLCLLLKVKREINRRLDADKPLHEIFLEQVRAHPTKLAAVEIETGREITYDEINRLMNRYANYFLKQGYKKGDVISLFMENGIDFFALWLGLSKIGVVSAFINSNLKLEPLAHSINVSKSRSVITTPTLLSTLQAAYEKELIDKSLSIVLSSDEGVTKNGMRVLSHELKGIPESEPPSQGATFHDVLCYIYTSGTTGNPKPAVIKHYRYYWMCMGAGYSFGIRPDDIIYITMPMYHSAAGILGIGSLIAMGTTAVIRRKFSASNFWKDCVKYNCTGSQYIGEICRYLLAQKPIEEETKHKVRVMWGNGLRAELWKPFVERFGIKRIGELYGSTEGNSNIINIDNYPGACGFMPIYPFISFLYPIRLIRIDEETGEVMRDARGLCIPCKPGQVGEMVGVIKTKDALLKFEGYVNEGDTKKKIYKNVFKKGDECFASGDILLWDDLGYLYFRDRRGDTFRWKGENVSTTEVEKIMQPIMAVEDSTVYGVEVGKMEGRAGMAGIVLRDGEDVNEFLKSIAQRLTANLASYAVPLFIRLCKTVDRTGTFKLKKTDLQKQGYDLSKCNGDSVYYWNTANKAYEPLTEQMQKDIDTGAYNRF
ncbi:hypothetical protein WR25_18296 [Diploscapter pachys]|uniref:Very long-chain fatty acid transport protein n=1 Tax=Diploscapter pachys TaxID=2018661 RepID=A0A2A2LE86_9BILA|nr:hypothetical protein WR25_18296 [Diploscapter pachys]